MAQPTGTDLAVSGLSHAFGAADRDRALQTTDLTVAAGEFAALIGPSGCGKSTLLKALAGLIVPSAGGVAIGGADVRGRPGHAAFMPQGSALLPWRRAWGNAILGAEVSGVPVEATEARARELFGTFGLEGFEDHWPSQLSGGMQQRLALLRTFLTPKPVLLLDEPLGALDAITRRAMQDWLQTVWRADGRTVLLVTHDIEEALILADTVHIMSARPGRITASIDVKLPRPRGIGVTTRPDFVDLKARALNALRDVNVPVAGAA